MAKHRQLSARLYDKRRILHTFAGARRRHPEVTQRQLPIGLGSFCLKSAGRLGMMPCAQRQRCERNRAFSRRSSSVMKDALLWSANA